MFSKRMDGLQSKELLMLMELAGNPEIISFAGGFPAEDSFPYEEMKAVTKTIFDEVGPGVLQYETTSGYEPLREQIAQRMAAKQSKAVDVADILITSGGQQALSMAGMLYLDEGDIVLVESPSYIGALNAFKTYRPNFIEVPCDDEGMNLTSLSNLLERMGMDIKMIYVIPDFQNPTGRVWSKKRREDFMALVAPFQMPIVEDIAYYDLAYETMERPMLKSLDTQGQVISIGTFSKIFCPGLRVGWIQADPLHMAGFRLLKPNVDLSSSSIAQRQIHGFMARYSLEDHIKSTCELYKKRRDVMAAALKRYFPKEVTYHIPHGGLFVWVELAEGQDAKVLLEKALKKGVAFVPAESFYAKKPMTNSFRMNFSCMCEDRIEKGVQLLAEAIKED